MKDNKLYCSYTKYFFHIGLTSMKESNFLRCKEYKHLFT